jgi:glycosyltransferase involved in cell wall biosynthesis
MRQRAMICWGISSFYGWGVYGLNLALAWAADPDIDPVAILPIERRLLAVDPLRMAMLDRFLKESAALVDMTRGHQGPLAFDIPILTGVGQDFMQAFGGEPTIGLVFFEKPQLDPAAIARAKSIPLIVAGSTWNERILREHGLTNVTKVLQGIDPALFHVARRSGIMGDRFKVFSGGKLELRKGQDIVMAAFARFAPAHPDALLVTAWHSPWVQFGRTLDITGRAAPMTYDANGAIDARAWAAANGIPSHQFLDLGFVPNAHMPPILREMDAALFTNRSEGGTNLVAMECMACGVPTILSANTGHLDLIDDDCCYPLSRQRGVSGFGAGIGETPGWGDTDTDEVVDALERAYTNRAEARRRGAAGAKKLTEMTWAKTAAKMKEIVLSFDVNRRQVA